MKKPITLMIVAIVLAITLIAIDNPFVTEVERPEPRSYEPVVIDEKWHGYQPTVNVTELQPAVVER